MVMMKKEPGVKKIKFRNRPLSLLSFEREMGREGLLGKSASRQEQAIWNYPSGWNQSLAHGSQAIGYYFNPIDCLKEASDWFLVFFLGLEERPEQGETFPSPFWTLHTFRIKNKTLHDASRNHNKALFTSHPEF